MEDATVREGLAGTPHRGALIPRTPKISSNSSSGCDFGEGRVRIDACRKGLYSYDRCRAHGRETPDRPGIEFSSNLSSKQGRTLDKRGRDDYGDDRCIRR